MVLLKKRWNSAEIESFIQPDEKKFWDPYEFCEGKNISIFLNRIKLKNQFFFPIFLVSFIVSVWQA